MFKLIRVLVVIVVVLVVLGAVFGDKKPSLETGSSVKLASLTPEQAIRRADSIKKPDLESQFIQVVSNFQNAYNNARDEFARGANRPARKQAICALPLGRSLGVQDWVGQISTRSTNGDGKGVLSIALAPDINIQTWNNSFSDIADGTLIEPVSSLFSTMGSLQTGDYVKVSGRFYRSDVDCVKEGSVSLSGSLKSPDFIFHFDRISKVEF